MTLRHVPIPAGLIRLLLAVSLATAALPLAPARPAHACSCAAPPSASVALAEAAAVFRGNVASIEAGNPLEGLITVNLEVLETWKGAEPGTATVRTAANEAACGFSFQPGAEYLVYANESESGSLVVYFCSRTTLAGDASADLATLGPGNTAPDIPDGGGLAINEPHPFPTRLALLAAVLVALVLGLGGALIISRMDNNPDVTD